jgi:altronate hydrolase
LDEIGQEILDQVAEVACGAPSKSEALGHQEFIMTYKSFAPKGPSCLPL